MLIKNRLLLATAYFLNTLCFTKNILDNDGITKYILNTLLDIFNKNRKDEVITNTKLNYVISKIDPDKKGSLDKGIKKAQSILKDHGKRILSSSTSLIYKHSEKTYKTVKNTLSHESGIPFTFAYPDEVAIDRINKMQNLFIRNHYNDDVTKQVKKVIVETIDNNRTLNTKQIANELRKNLKDIEKQKGYFETVVSQVLNNARSYSNMRFYSEADIMEYEVVAVMDESTTVQCQFMNGQVLSVPVTLNRYKLYDEAKSIDEVKQVNPWISAKSIDGEAILSVNGKVIDRNMTGADLQNLGLSAPPYHARCRTTVWAVL